MRLDPPSLLIPKIRQHILRRLKRPIFIADRRPHTRIAKSDNVPATIPRQISNHPRMLIHLPSPGLQTQTCSAPHAQVENSPRHCSAPSILRTRQIQRCRSTPAVSASQVIADRSPPAIPATPRYPPRTIHPANLERQTDSAPAAATSADRNSAHHRSTTKGSSTTLYKAPAHQENKQSRASAQSLND